MDASRNKVASQVNTELLSTYWKIGEIVIRYEQNDQIRAAYGEKTLKQLSKALSKEFGKGFSVSNVQFMRRFYQEYQIQQTLSVKLSWLHYCELLSISDMDKRRFYEKECIASGWSVCELKRQKESSLFERLLFSKGEAKKNRCLLLQITGYLMQTLKISFVLRMYLNFLDTRKKPFLVSDLEAALGRQIEDFLLELGR